MLVFATEIPIDPTRNTTDLIALARKWLGGSPYFKVPEASIPMPKDGEISEVDVGGAQVAVGAVSTDKFNLAGVQMSRVEAGRFLWTTEVVGNKSDVFWASVRVYCEAVGSVLELPKAKKPYILKQIIEDFGTGLDADMKVSGQPFFLKPTDLERAAKLISGSFGNRLPVVYVSAGRANHPAVECGRLSKFLSGLAHVVVEPSRLFARRLMEQVDGRNAYGGAVGVYWPDGMGRREKFFEQDYDSPSLMEKAIAEYVEQSLANRRPTLFCTWAFLRETISRQAIIALKAAGSTEINDYVAAFDNELSAKQQQLEAAEAEIARLQSEVRRFEAMPKVEGASPLLDGKERDLYPGERRGLLVNILRDALNNLNSDSRRSHLVADIIKANDVGAPSDVLAEQVKDCLRNYSSMGKKERKILEDIGFEITEEGKHYKAVFMDDARYVFVIARTPSDHRAGLNLASDIKKKLF